jgi:hypothetical protein
VVAGKVREEKREPIRMATRGLDMHSTRKRQWIAAKYARALLTALLFAIAPKIAQAVSLSTSVNASVPSSTGCNFSSDGSSVVCGDGIGVSQASAFAQAGHIGAKGAGSSLDPFNSLQAIALQLQAILMWSSLASKNRIR